MGKRVGLVTRRRKEPRLHRPARAHPLDPPRPLGQPHVEQPAAEQAALPGPGRRTPKVPSRPSITAASTPSPSSVQRNSWRQVDNAGEPSARIRVRHTSKKVRSGSASCSEI